MGLESAADCDDDPWTPSGNSSTALPDAYDYILRAALRHGDLHPRELRRVCAVA